MVKKVNPPLIEKCLCGKARFSISSRNAIPTAKCESCGLTHQYLLMEKKVYDDYYEDNYHHGIYNHSFEHDVEVARKRIENYNLSSSIRLLDIGCGNGAFVVEARKRGIEAWGNEIAVGACQAPQYTYEKDLLEINFPTEYFDVITLHDVIEHLLNPKDYLKEIFRILKPEGVLIIDLPDFWTREGKHHWKSVEHLWFFTVKQLKKILEEMGFLFKESQKPIESKVLLLVTKPSIKRKSILLPPGIGDIYWTLAKLESFIEKEKTGMPDVFISSPIKGKDRSIEYVKRIPFLNAAGYRNHSTKTREFHEAYMLNKRTIFKNVAGCDYFIAFNGPMRYGRRLEDIESKYSVNWDLPMFESLGEKQFHDRLKDKIGDYLVGYFVPHGMYKYWLKEFSIEEIAKTLEIISSETGKKIVLIGSHWDKDLIDKELMEALGKKYLFNLTGETSVEEVFGMLRYSDGVIGFPSGITIMATAFKTKTFMLWNRYFHSGFWKHSCPPKAWQKWYSVSDTRTSDSELVSKSFIELLEGKPKKVNLPESLPVNTTGLMPTKYEIPVEKICNNGRVTIACVLKSGGDYDGEYVRKLKNSIQRNLTLPHRFVCLTDMNVDCDKIKLKNNYPGWWSKIELFRPGLFNTKVIYFDLDTVILHNIDRLIKHDHRFSMLHGMRKETMTRRASGIMAWNGNYSFIYDEFQNLSEKEIEQISWDQKFIIKILRDRGVEPEVIQEIFQGVMSYKNNIRGRQILPREAKIICFHGKPRPHEALRKERWLRKAWK